VDCNLEGVAGTSNVRLCDVTTAGRVPRVLPSQKIIS
jgi:hypothetical protein